MTMALTLPRAAPMSFPPLRQAPLRRPVLRLVGSRADWPAERAALPRPQAAPHPAPHAAPPVAAPVDEYDAERWDGLS